MYLFVRAIDFASSGILYYLIFGIVLTAWYFLFFILLQMYIISLWT